MSKEQFDALPDNEKRIAVARDIIASVQSGFYELKEGVYFNEPEEFNRYAMGEEQVTNIIEYLDGCRVCIIGAALVSIIKIQNSVTFWELKFQTKVSYANADDARKVYDLVHSVFGSEIMVFLENIFEGTVTGSRIGAELYDYYGDKVVQKEIVWEWIDAYPDTRTRAIKMMENIINNDGKFIPEDI